jgi:hypothetical protein
MAGNNTAREKYTQGKPFDFVREFQKLQNAVKSMQIQSPGLQDIWHYVGDSATGLGTAFGGAWGNRGGNWARLAFRKETPNLVRVMGGITIGTASTQLFGTLPVEYIPSSEQALRYIIVAGGTTAPWPQAAFNVQTDGNVVQNGNGTGGATAGWVSDVYSLDI